ncbi:MAG: DHH family phosphoesterase, partial [Pseudomonadota bacterium]
MKGDDQKLVSKIADSIQAAENILITIHESPDGDAVGSMLALNDVLKLMKKNIFMYSPDVIPMKLRFMKGWETVTSDDKKLAGRDLDLLIMLDCGDKKRSGKFIKELESYKTLINIDHHVSNDLFGDINFVDAKSSCTAEKVYDVVKELLSRLKQNKIPLDTATSLLAALYDDTGGMRYASTTPHTLSVAADLVANGADCSYVSENLFFSVSREKM